MAQSKEHADSIRLTRRDFCAGVLAFAGSVCFLPAVDSWQAENRAVDALAHNKAITETPLALRPYRLTDEELKNEAQQIEIRLKSVTRKKRIFLAGFTLSAAAIARIYYKEIKELFFVSRLQHPTPAEILASEVYSERKAFLASSQYIGGRSVSPEEAVILLCEGEHHKVKNVQELTHPL